MLEGLGVIGNHEAINFIKAPGASVVDLVGSWITHFSLENISNYEKLWVWQ